VANKRLVLLLAVDQWGVVAVVEPHFLSVLWVVADHLPKLSFTD
jgi:hypothetical protein